MISVILPVHNQAEHIENVVRQYSQALTQLTVDHEMILVTNGCRDNSVDLCASLASTFPGIQTIDTARRGWGLAVRLGLSRARGDIMCYTNSARTSPEELALMLRCALGIPGFVVKANRKIRESLRRRLGSLLFNLECRALFDVPYWDINGTPKIFPRSFDRLMRLTRDDDLIDAEFAVICRQESYPVLEVPVFSTRRFGGRSTTSYRSAMRMYWGAFEMWRIGHSKP